MYLHEKKNYRMKSVYYTSKNIKKNRDSMDSTNVLFSSTDYNNSQLKISTNSISNVNETNNIDAEIEKVLSVKVFRGELVNYSYVFNQGQIDKIYIGNNESCNIVLNDNLLDDIHCSIEYKRNI